MSSTFLGKVGLGRRAALRSREGASMKRIPTPSVHSLPFRSFNPNRGIDQNHRRFPTRLAGFFPGRARGVIFPQLRKIALPQTFAEELGKALDLLEPECFR